VGRVDGFHSVKQAAALLGVSQKTVRSWIHEKTLEAVWEDRGVGQSQWWIPMEAISRTLAKNQPEGHLEGFRGVEPVPQTPTNADVAQMIEAAVQNAVQGVVRTELDRFEARTEARADERDQRLMEVLRAVQNERRRSFFQRLFGM